MLSVLVGCWCSLIVRGLRFGFLVLWFGCLRGAGWALLRCSLCFSDDCGLVAGGLYFWLVCLLV